MSLVSLKKTLRKLSNKIKVLIVKKKRLVHLTESLKDPYGDYKFIMTLLSLNVSI